MGALEQILDGHACIHTQDLMFNHALEQILINQTSYSLTHSTCGGTHTWCACVRWNTFLMCMRALEHILDVHAWIGTHTWYTCVHWNIYLMCMRALVHILDVHACIGTNTWCACAQWNKRWCACLHWNKYWCAWVHWYTMRNELLCKYCR